MNEPKDIIKDCISIQEAVGFCESYCQNIKNWIQSEDELEGDFEIKIRFCLMTSFEAFKNTIRLVRQDLKDKFKEYEVEGYVVKLISLHFISHRGGGAIHSGKGQFVLKLNRKKI